MGPIYDTEENVAKLGEADPELTKYLESDEEKLPYAFMSLEELQHLFKSNPVPTLPRSEFEFVLNIPMRDGHVSELRVHKSKVGLDAGILIVLVHGGGFCLGHNTHISVLSRALASLYNAAVVNVSYRLAPEHQFPIAPNDIWDSLQWITAHTAAELGIDKPKHFIVGGVSAGANLAAVATQKWVSDFMEPRITGMWLNIPILLEKSIVPAKYKELWFSRSQNADSICIGAKDIEYCMATYNPDIRSPDFSPFNANNAHTGLPPVYIQVCGQDPLRDDGLIYEKALRDNGVLTKLDVYPGVPHGFADLFPSLNLSRKSYKDTLKGVGWLLGQHRTDEECASACLNAMVKS